MKKKIKFNVSPSSINYDLGGCHRCYAEKQNGEKWPDRPFPGIFSRLDRQQRAYYDNQPSSLIDASLPNGTIKNAAGIRSVPFVHDGIELTVKGTLDAIIEFKDGTTGIIDYKSSIPQDSLGERYRPQLSAYNWALSNPAVGQAKEISLMGLLIVCPESMQMTELGPAQLVSTTWIPVEYDHEWFIELMTHIAKIVKNPETAESNPYCEYCILREQLEAA